MAHRKLVALLTGLALALGATVTVGLASAADSGDVGWGSWGNTANQNRHSSASLIDVTNVSQLGRLFTVDFLKIDPTLKRGQQSFPIVVDGKLYVTTGDANVFSIDATNGKVNWRWAPASTAVFKNFGIVANRGVAVCGGHVYVLLLDMTIVQLDAATGALVKQVPIGKAVPGAAANFGYSETSAPICANGRIIIGAAGSEYGVRGFVMAYNLDLTPAWPNPFWTIPPEGTQWRSQSRIVGGGVVWTPTTVDPKTNTLYFGTGSATPLYYAELRPGSNPRADSLIAVDLATGKLKWWQQQMAFNEWSYDTAQPPMVYDGKVGGKKRHVVSVATMEGVWFAYDADTGQPFYQRIKLIDRSEHPPLKAGEIVTVYPSSLGGINFSPASYDPKTNYVLNSASETAAYFVKMPLTAEQKKRKLLLGDVFLGLGNGSFGTQLTGWRDHGSISAIDVDSGKQVWKFKTPEPERGGVTTTDGGIGFAGGGDGVLRAFETATGKPLWSFQTGLQIASGPTVYQIAGKQYVAITSGGTPTSSGGGTVGTQLHVFALGASQTQSKAPNLPKLTQARAAAAAPAQVVAEQLTISASAAVPLRQQAVESSVARRTAFGTPHLRTAGGLALKPWDANTSNQQDAKGTLVVGNSPVAGAKISVDGYVIPAATADDGSFTYPVDITMARRHVARVADASGATVGGKALSAADQAALQGVSGGFSVGYTVDRVKTSVNKDGSIRVTGRVADTAGTPPPIVGLYTYQLEGTITDAAGKPVQGAVIVTRTNDRQFWTFSSASDATGHYTSFFSASDQSTDDPVPYILNVAIGATNYVYGPQISFARTRSARMDIKLPTAGGAFAAPTIATKVGAVYQGLVVGVRANGAVVKPTFERWPDATGAFSMVLPATLRGKTVTFWQNQRIAYSTVPQLPGDRVDLREWPKALGPQVPTGLGSLTLPK